MNIDTLLLYLVVAFFYITSPGPAIILAIINGLRTNLKTVAITSLANCLGLFILSTASILGLGLVLTTSATLFMIVKTIGAFYLIYLGIKFLRNRGGLNIDENKEKFVQKTQMKYFLEAFILAITNPKPILFFAAIFPQFLNLNTAIAPQFFIMTGIFVFISFFSLFSYAYLAKRSKAYLQNKRSVNIINKITGGIFIFMGIGLLRLKNNL